MVKKILIRIQKMPAFYSWVLLFVLQVLASAVVQFIFEIILKMPTKETIFNFYDSQFLYFFSAVIFAPIVETFIFQGTVYWILKDGLKCKTLGICICSAIIFGLAHHYSLIYILITALSGFLLQLWYIIYMKKYGWEYAFCLIASAHSFYNFIGFIIHSTFST